MRFKMTTLLSFFMGIMAIIFGIKFPGMMYWEGSEKGIPRTMVWYWVGAALTYLSLLCSYIFILMSLKSKVGIEDAALMVIGFILNFLTLYFTSFAIIMGLG